ncbi:YybS family protein [Metabacillus arenae]|uniref:YybS family protein n=1 Tax=Metabacillus arenae TaxID=2771434 RepID=A0A926NG30_9BACI|nr:YybS family protein [Metabacillus arenae]MBD1379843.1 YybS family protein [Metabacillus arenae]
MKQTNFLTEGAVLLALYAVLLFLVIYIPVIGVVLMFGLALPFIIIAYRYSIKQSLLVYFASLLLSMLIANVSGIGTTLIFATAGILMGHYYKKNQTMSAIIAGSLSYFVTTAILYSAVIAFLQIDIPGLIEESFQQSISLFQSMGQDIGDEQLKLLKEQLQTAEYMFPSVFVITGVILSFITHLICSLMLRRLKVQIQPLPPFREWSLPKNLIWYYLIATILMLFNLEKGSYWYIAALNVYYVLNFAMTVQGLSFVYFYSHHKKVSKALPILVTVFSIILPFLQQIVRILGIIDLGFNLRTRIKQVGK